ncbi:MAG: FtsB family cell division protein [Actinomycetota bacterium]
MKALAYRLRPRVRLPRFGLGPQIVAFVLVLGLAAAMVATPIRQLVAQRERIEGMTQELRLVERQNGRLATQIGRLNDADYLEQQARAKFGLVRPGEKLFQVLPPSGSSGKAKASPAPPAPEPPSWIEGLLHFLGL